MRGARAHVKNFNKHHESQRREARTPIFYILFYWCFILHGSDVGVDGELLEELGGVGQGFGDVIRMELAVYRAIKRKK